MTNRKIIKNRKIEALKSLKEIQDILKNPVYPEKNLK